MLEILFVFLTFPFLVNSESTTLGQIDGSYYRYGTTQSTSSVWQKCRKPSIIHAEMNCEILWGGGYYPVQTADCEATCDDGYMLIGMTLYICVVLFLISHFHTLSGIWNLESASLNHPRPTALSLSPMKLVQISFFALLLKFVQGKYYCAMRYKFTYT